MKVILPTFLYLCFLSAWNLPESLSFSLPSSLLENERKFVPCFRDTCFHTNKISPLLKSNVTFRERKRKEEKEEKRKKRQTSQFLKKFKFISNSDQNSGSET